MVREDLAEPMELLLESLRQELAGLVRMAPRLALAAVVLLLAVLAGRLVGRMVARALERGRLSSTHRTFFRGVAAWIVYLVGTALALDVLGLTALATSLVAGGSLTAIVLGFAFRGIGENLLAGFFLAFSRPFEVGDLIESGGLRGLVRGIELRSTHVRTADGRDIFIPSAQIFNEPLINFTRDGLRRPSFRVGIDYRDDVEAARRLLLEAVRDLPGVLERPPPRVTIAEFAAAYVELEVAFWIDGFDADVDLLEARSAAMERCRRALADGGYTFSSEVTTGVVLDAPPGPDAGAGPAAPAGEPGAATGEDG